METPPLGGRARASHAGRRKRERRALEGELHLLESAWKDAEEIAGIADDMFLPASISERLARLKQAVRDE